MTAIDLVKKYIPDASDEFAEYILWNHTGAPCFFERGIASLISQIKRFKVLMTWKANQCDFCSNASKENVCCFCREAFSPPHQGNTRGE